VFALHQRAAGDVGLARLVCVKEPKSTDQSNEVNVYTFFVLLESAM
jgi:hypothetical protein